MTQPNDLSRCLAALDQDSTLIAVVEMSQSSWLVAGIVPGIERHPVKKLEPDELALLGLLHRWRDEGRKADRSITASPLPLRLVATASGWPAGCWHVMSKRTSSTRPAWPCRVSIDGRRPTDSIPSC